MVRVVALNFESEIAQRFVLLNKARLPIKYIKLVIGEIFSNLEVSVQSCRVNSIAPFRDHARLNPDPPNGNRTDSALEQIVGILRIGAQRRIEQPTSRRQRVAWCRRQNIFWNGERRFLCVTRAHASKQQQRS